MEDIKNYSVYALIFPDERLYIGSTRQEPAKRWRCGRGYRNSERVHKAIQESGGWDYIVPLVIADGMDKETAMILEQELIKKYHTQDERYGLNTKNGGQSFGQHSEEFLNSLHNRMVGNKYCVGRKLRPSHIEALRQANLNSHRPSKLKGKAIHTEEQKQLFSEMAKERWKDPEYRQKAIANHPRLIGQDNPMYGKHHSEETRKKMSEKKKGRKLGQQHIEALKQVNRKPVLMIKNGEVLRRFDSITEAADYVGACKENIGFACRHSGRTSKGYEWRYAADSVG